MPGKQCEQTEADEPLEVMDSLSGLDLESWDRAEEMAAWWERASPWEYPSDLMDPDR